MSLRVMSFQAFGRPAPQGSKSYGATGDMREASRFLKAWRESVKLAALRARREQFWREPVAGPCAMAAVCSLQPPETSEFGWYPAGPPDWDKLARGICDALTEAQVWVDDARCVDGHVRKVWAGSSHPDALTRPGAIITVWELS